MRMFQLIIMALVLSLTTNTFAVITDDPLTVTETQRPQAIQGTLQFFATDSVELTLEDAGVVMSTSDILSSTVDTASVAYQCIATRFKFNNITPVSAFNDVKVDGVDYARVAGADYTFAGRMWVKVEVYYGSIGVITFSPISDREMDSAMEGVEDIVNGALYSYCANVGLTVAIPREQVTIMVLRTAIAFTWIEDLDLTVYEDPKVRVGYALMKVMMFVLKDMLPEDVTDAYILRYAKRKGFMLNPGNFDDVEYALKLPSDYTTVDQ